MNGKRSSVLAVFFFWKGEFQLMNKIKRIVAMMLAIVMSITVLPQSTKKVQAATGEASLVNIGRLGTVNIGEKSESGTWLKTMVNGKPVFCQDLGKACHTGDVYVSSNDEISSDNSNKKISVEAKTGYWYAYVKKKANKAWVYAQCLIWSAEEGRTSESQLKDVIKQVRNNTGYYNDKTVNEIYNQIFNIDHTVICSISKWTSSAYSRQVLMEINSTDEEEDYKYYPLNDTLRYRQRITLTKKDEDNKALPKVKFLLTAKNVKELYSFKFNGWGDAESGDVDEDQSRFEIEALTDTNGKITYKFDYQIQSEDYYYCKADDLKEMTDSAKKEIKNKLDDEGYKYASDLSKSGAEKLIQSDFDKQMKAINNKYVVKELDTGNANIIAQGSIAKGVTITIQSDKSWVKENGVWPDTSSGKYGSYEKAYQFNVKNNYKKVKLIAIKKDNETGEVAQGDATLAGAVYGMYEDYGCTKLLKKYTTDSRNQFETDYVRCGSDYYLKEIVPPVGYLKNDKVYKIHEDGQEYTAEYNSAKSKLELGEDVVKGKVSIIKGKGNGNAGIVSPEVNAQFQVYIASSGSYDKAKDTEKDLLKTNSEGYAITKELPYGTYIVHQISGDDETEYCPDFYVDIKEQGKTYKYLLNNPEFTAYLKIVKKDAQTKKTVLKPNTTYQIYKVNDDGTEMIVKQSYNNGNKIITVDRFVSDDTGEIITYEKLKAGKYRVYEVQGPEGFKNNKSFINIEITNKSYKTMTDKDGNEYLYAEYEYYNDETYGKFTIKKTGPGLTGFEYETIMKTSNVDSFIYTNAMNVSLQQNPFKYEDVMLNDVVFELYAKDDIVTQDGQNTTWFKAGELVATITTGSGAEFMSDCNGICKAKLEENGAVTLDVPLGEYEIKEVKTTYGHVLQSTNSWNLKFVWNSQEEEYVSDISDNTQDGVLDIRNELVSTEVRVTKKDARTSKPVPDTTFGFYTKDNIYDKDGNVILKAGSKITKVKTDKDGKAIIPFPVPVMGERYGDKDLPINSGDYYFLEENISDSYYISEEPIFVHLEYKNQETPIVTAEAKVVNEQTEVEVDKLMIASSVEIPNCHLKISDENGNEIVSWITGDKDSIIGNEKLEEMGYFNFEAKMNENGNIKINGLLHDKEYVLTETKPADGFVSATDISFMLKLKIEKADYLTQIFIKENEKFVPAISNKLVMYDDTTKIEFSKTEITGEKEIPGCELEVTDKETGRIMDKWTSSKDKHIVEGKYVVGKTYMFTEKRPASGFATAESVEFKISDTGNIQQVSMKDDTIKIQFSKIASDTKKLLPGAKYKVLDSKGKKVCEFTTKKKETALNGILCAGETYTFVEHQAPKHYKKAKNVKITVKDTGKMQKIKVVDERIPEVPDTPQTGYNKSIYLYVLALLFGIGMLAKCLNVKNRYRKKQDEE